MPIRHTKSILYSAAAFNISGGLAIIIFLEIIAPFVRFAPLGNMLFRLFVGGTAITFGIAYFRTARMQPLDSSVLYYGTGLKYWAFAASMIAFLFAGLSIEMLVLFGCANLCFAILFTMILVSGKNPMSSEH
jgi:hypothetical protein